MKEILLVLMEALEQQENSLLLHLVKQIEDVAKVYIIRLIIVIHLLIENKIEKSYKFPFKGTFLHS